MENHQINKPIFTEKIDYANPYDFSKIHRHSYFEIMLFRRASGSGTNAIDFIDYPIQKNSLHIIAPSQAHLMQRQAKDNGILIQFTKEYLISHSHSFHAEWLFSLQSNPMNVLEEDRFEKLYPTFVHLHDLISKRGNFNEQIVTHYFLYIIFQVLEILNSKTQKKVSSNSIRFLGLVEKQFKENRTIADYAQQMNISMRKLTSDIKNSFGKTPLQFIHDMLAIEIKRLIMVEEISQKEIAYELNFDSPASYTRFVKKYFNCKPTELKTLSIR